MTKREVAPDLWMLAGAFAFAVMGACTHALGSRCDWLIVALVRAGFMFTATASLATAAGVRLMVWRPRTLWIRSLAGSFSLVCNFFALSRLPVADALTLSNTYPLWIVLMGALLLRQRPSTTEVCGVVSGLVGVALIQRPHLGGSGDGFATTVALVSSVSTAVALLGLHRLRHLDTRAVVAHFAGVATLVSLAWLATRPQILTPALLRPTTLLLLSGVAVSGTIGQFCLTRAYAMGTPARMSVIGLTQVVFAIGFDVVLWHRSLTPPILVGFALVLAPTAWLSGRARRRIARDNRPEATPRETLPTPQPAEPGASAATRG
jgi:drug/metabolite transporter (DMT)-like permease